MNFFFRLFYGFFQMHAMNELVMKPNSNADVKPKICPDI